jgi:hypothetical protein
MLVTFKSKAAADIIMYKEHAKRILDLFNKDVDRGVITAEETDTALAKLNAAIEESRASAAQDQDSSNDAERRDDSAEDQETQMSRSVSFATRAYPFLEMLRAAKKGGYDIAWGI